MRDKREFYAAARKEPRKRERENNLTHTRAPKYSRQKRIKRMRDIERGGLVYNTHALQVKP